MGMSAAQARLLSITTRLTNNEFRSQTITNSKLRLADKSAEASQEYMDALNSQKLVYNYYNDNGESEQLSLTPGLIYTYSPLKNQYALINSSGKMLVSAKDAENFENSADLAAFLEKYNLYKSSTSSEKYKKDLEYYNTVTKPAYDAELKKYDSDKTQYDKDKADYDENKAAWDKYNKDKADYDRKMAEIAGQPDLYKEYCSIVGTSDTVQNQGAQGHYYRALYSGNADCFLHVLNVLLDYNGASLSTSTYNTSADGITVTLEGQDGGMTSELTLDQKTKMASISAALEKRNCDGMDVGGSGKYNLLEVARKNGNVPTELDILKSDYKEIDNGDGTYSYELKNLKQKTIDMYYIIQHCNDFKDESGNTLITAEIMKELLTNFTEGDMKLLTPEEPTRPTETLGEPKEPIMPTPPKEPTPPTIKITLNDKDKAQWYVNLWHMMNGSDTANLVKTTEYKYQNSDNSGDVNNETIFSVENAYRNPQTKNYAIFDDNLINNADWLQFALEHGIVTLAKAEFFDPSEDSGKTPELTSTAITWKSTIFSNASEFIYVDDETAIAIAEVKYKNKINEIENKDKKFDQDLKKLDTEHTALQTEYESIKEAMNKNIERSFKAFS